MGSQTDQNGRPARRSRKPQTLKEKAAALHIAEQSNREIGRELGVKHQTVPNMLADSDLLKEYRHRLSRRVPQALENIDLLPKPSKRVSMEIMARTTMWLLEYTQVGVKKTTADVSHAMDFLAGTIAGLSTRTLFKLLFRATSPQIHGS